MSDLPPEAHPTADGSSAARTVVRRSRRIVLLRIVSVLLVLGAIGLAAAVGSAVSRRLAAEGSDADRAASRYDPPSASVAAAPIGPVTVVTDGVGGPARDGRDPEWVTMLEQSLDTSVSLITMPGAGFTMQDGRGDTLLAGTSRVRPGTATVVIMGGDRDAGIAAAAEAKSVSAMAGALRDSSPTTRVIIVGPFASVESGDAGVTVASVVRNAAEEAAVVWADPMEQPEWLVSPTGRGGDLSAKDQVQLARRLGALISAS